MLDLAAEFARFTRHAASLSEIGDQLGVITRAIGFRFFALANHVDIRSAPKAAFRVSNYPKSWQEAFERRRLGPVDPILRASDLTSIGFGWGVVPRMLHLSGTDRQILEMAAAEGVGDGYTVPAHIPGEANGSCSFAVATGDRAPTEAFSLAQLIGGFAFEGARRLSVRREQRSDDAPHLTDRQRDCLLWAARGKTDWEISRILGIRQDTVVQHLKQARERYGVQKRTLLTVRALFDGTISFIDVLKP